MLLVWNKIIRKMAHLLTNKKISKKEYILNELGANNNKIEENEDYYFIKNGNTALQLRKKGSDFNVYQQVVINKEYEPLIDFLKINQKTPSLIIDCGANIGLTSLQFAKNFPNTQIVALEPDQNNFELLKKNAKDYRHITPKHFAVWSANEILKIDRDFRDGQDWSIRTTKTDIKGHQTVHSITIDKLLSEISVDTIDLLKIDIEGAEKELFKDQATYSFLDKVNCIAIELHDECINRSEIYAILKEKGFMLFNSGELTIGFKQ